eukprot:355984-Chlamydomonas_euryale.AAC.4
MAHMASCAASCSGAKSLLASSATRCGSAAGSPLVPSPETASARSLRLASGLREECQRHVDQYWHARMDWTGHRTRSATRVAKCAHLPISYWDLDMPVTVSDAATALRHRGHNRSKRDLEGRDEAEKARAEGKRDGAAHPGGGWHTVNGLPYFTYIPAQHEHLLVHELLNRRQLVQRAPVLVAHAGSHQEVLFSRSDMHLPMHARQGNGTLSIAGGCSIGSYSTRARQCWL